MATFRVGQRVRVLRAGVYAECRAGSEGTITELNTLSDLLGQYHRVQVDGVPAKCATGWAIPAAWLAPLTDPDSKADEFIAKLKKLGPLPMKEIA